MTTREKIINAALKLFSSLGYEKTTTKLIASEAGVNELTIFRTFESKQILLEEVTRTYITGMSVNPDLQYIFGDDIPKTLNELSVFVMQKFFDNEMMFKIQLKIDIEDFERLNLSKFFVEKLAQYLKEKKVLDYQARAEYFVCMHLGFLTTYICDLYDKDAIESQRQIFVSDFIKTIK